jgi:hypothetical protein
VGRRVEDRAAELAVADVDLLARRFRHVESRLSVLTWSPPFTVLRSAVERMSAAAAATDDPAERLRLAVDCAIAIRPAALAILAEQDADFALPAGLVQDFSHWRPE